jgi:hypothetical protein
MESTALVRFKNFKQHFLNLTKRKCVYTQYDIISVEITHDSKFAVAILHHSDKLNYIRLYSLEEINYDEIKIKGKKLRANKI